MSRFPELTPRERDCLSWAAQGMTYQEIAGTLDVSPRTVEQHLASARSKLGAHSTAQAIAIATRRHMITPTPIPAGWSSLRGHRWFANTHRVQRYRPMTQELACFGSAPRRIDDLIRCVAAPGHAIPRSL